MPRLLQLDSGLVLQEDCGTERSHISEAGAAAAAAVRQVHVHATHSQKGPPRPSARLPPEEGCLCRELVGTCDCPLVHGHHAHPVYAISVRQDSSSLPLFCMHMRFRWLKRGALQHVGRDAERVLTEAHVSTLQCAVTIAS